MLKPRQPAERAQAIPPHAPPRATHPGAGWVCFFCAWLLFAGCKSKDQPGAADGASARPIPVLTAQVAQRDLPIFLDGLGTVAALRTVTVRPQVEGRLERVLFREGQRVSRGELLAQIDSRPFLATLHQAESALLRDEALLGNARKNLQRYKELREQNHISQQQLDDQQALVGQYEGAVGVDRAAGESARLSVEYARIVSPIDGVTGVRLIDEGNLVRPGDATGLLVITQIDPIAVLFTLPQDDLPQIIAHLPASPPIGSPATDKGAAAPPPKGQPVEAWSRDGSQRLGQGELLLLDNQINQGTATLRLKAVFPNPNRQLWPNQFVKARLLLSTKQNALVVPAVAVQRGPKGTDQAFSFFRRDRLSGSARYLIQDRQCWDEACDIDYELCDMSG